MDMMEMDDEDDELFPEIGFSKKPSSASSQTKSINKATKNDLFESHVQPDEAATTEEGMPSFSPSFKARNDKKFTFFDSGDCDEDDIAQTPHTKATSAKNQGDVTFDHAVDDLIDTLGLNDDENSFKKKDAALWSNEERIEAPQRTHTKLDKILESLTSSSLVERRLKGERKEPPLSQEKQLQDLKDNKASLPSEDDFTFGTYQPTVASRLTRRPSRRQFKRSTDDDSSSTPENKPKPTTPNSSQQRNSAADWLCLKPNDDDLFLEADAAMAKTAAESTKASSPSLERKPSLNGSHTYAAAAETPPSPDQTEEPTKLEASKSQGRGQEKEDWLAAALHRKKALPMFDTKASTQEDNSGLGKEIDKELILSKSVASQAPRVREATGVTEASNTFSEHPCLTAHSSPAREKRTMPAVPQQHEIQKTPSVITQQSQLPGGGTVGDAGVIQRCIESDQPPGDYQTLQARIIQLEGQVKTLHLELDKNQALEIVQQHHKKDMELMENAHKARVKLLEEWAAQREAQARRECDDLKERLAVVTQSAEQERSELQAQYQRKLAQTQQDRDREVERLKDLQRKSILEMKKDHEDQIQWLKKLKDEEIDAVTSATSQTRSLTVVIERMEQFSSRLGEISSRVESTHEHTAHGLEQGARHRDEQLRLMQDRLAQQQKAMAEERAHLKEIISRMDSQLNEQQRQLEKERWKVTAEQAKVESTQRGLEEERHALTLQISMEREELDRAKSALLEEQKSVIQHCAEERKKLAIERDQFHAMEKQRYERAERDVSSLLEKREGSIISLAQEQADLKLRTAELKQKEILVARETETLERLREELDNEKEQISSSALRVKTKAQEVEAFSKLAAEKYDEGERALQEAKHIEAMHEARLAKIHVQTERLRQQEQRILKDQIRLNHLQNAMETQTLESPVNPFQSISPILSENKGSMLPKSELQSTTRTTLALANVESTSFQTSLALWKYNTDKDSRYIEDEQIFLDKLKKKTYKPF
ncbi:fas-binding factor 1 homolog [Antennarius striatus]|uniref:fas-binding factor 1 homolog n=1 Tax=Antennarius striatus TaxID=241820 RepID=UPI0035AF2AAB